MLIHIVQAGETAQSIADLYGVPVELVIENNAIEVSVSGSELIQGQAIVITFPAETYVVQNGDTLQSIADQNGVTVLELLRNNPYLLDRQYIYPGESLVISFGEKIRKVTTNGYASSFIDLDILRKTLPFLTYLSVFGYRVTDDGEVAEIDDTDILQLAKTYGVAPFLIITSLSTLGQRNVENAYAILNNQNNMDKLIDNLVAIMKKKGYYGVNIAYELLTDLTLPAYVTFNTKAYERFKEEGLNFVVTISPNIIFTASEITFERVDYSKIVDHADGVVVLNYLWGSYLGPPAPLASMTKLREFLDYLIPMVSPEKIVIGMPLIAYDWELPYAVGITKASSLTLESAFALAKEHKAVIQFDEPSQTPFFTYSIQVKRISIEHVVWFIDARSVDAILKEVTDRGLGGSGLWNIARFIPQLWAVINSQYEIEHIPAAEK